MRTDLKPVSAGRLFILRLERSKAAREEALASIREIPGGWWQARIGGKIRGTTQRFPSKTRALAAVNNHYNAKLMDFIKREAKTWTTS